VDDLNAAWAKKPSDFGVGLINIRTGEIHVGSFDTQAQGIGHDGLQMTLGFPDAERPLWRGFGISSTKQPLNGSYFNHIDGTPPKMHPAYWAAVVDALQRAGLL
jgi:hypothetical protein